MPTQSSHLIYAQCSLGLESLLFEEIAGFGLEPRLVSGGVEVRGTTRELAHICLVSRLVESVRVRLKRFKARDFAGLKKGLSPLPFRAYRAQGAPFTLHVTCKKSRLWHSGAVEERVSEVLSSHVGWVPAVDPEAADVQRVYVRLEEDDVQVSLDAGGPRMHRRGYRKMVERASLRETLAAALLSSCESIVSDPGERVIWDPFCGAGTILLEALHRDSGRLAGQERVCSLEQWRSHDEETFSRWRREWAGPPRNNVRVIGSDVATKAISAATANAASLGGDARASFLLGDVADVASEIPVGAWVVSNPPYGKRIADAEVINKLLQVLSDRPDLKPAVCLIGGPARSRLDNKSPALFRTKNGGLSVSARLLST